MSTQTNSDHDRINNSSGIPGLLGIRPLVLPELLRLYRLLPELIEEVEECDRLDEVDGLDFKLQLDTEIVESALGVTGVVRDCPLGGVGGLRTVGGRIRWGRVRDATVTLLAGKCGYEPDVVVGERGDSGRERFDS